MAHLCDRRGRGHYLGDAAGHGRGVYGQPTAQCGPAYRVEFRRPGIDDSGFDTSPVRFTMDPGRAYGGSVYLRSANPGGVSQDVNISLPVFGFQRFVQRRVRLNNSDGDRYLDAF